MIIIIFLLMIEIVNAVPNQPSIVRTDGYRILVQKRFENGTLSTQTPFIIKGVAWSPAGVGTGGGQFATWYQTDIPLMAQLNANTIRTWGTFPVNSTGLAILDKCYSNNIFVIMTVDEQNYTSAVNYFKNHPAILMWLLGNEWNYNLFYGRYTTIDQCITAINNASAGIKALDPNHPVATCYGDLPTSAVLSQCTGPDVWGLNCYRGLSFGSLFSDWKIRASKPMFFTEHGADAYNNNIPSEDQNSQAYALSSQWNQIINNLSALNPNNVCVGACMMEWNDEWWKAGNYSSHDTGGFANGGVYPDGYANEEWWGIVDIYRNPRAAYNTIKSIYQNLIVNFETGQSGNQNSTNISSSEVLEPDLKIIKRIISLKDDLLEIKISLPDQNDVTLKIYDINGNLLDTIIENKTLSKGDYTYYWEPKDLKNNEIKRGIYYCVLETYFDAITKKEMFVVDK